MSEMFEDMNQEDKYQLGLLIGHVIKELFELVAKVDGLTFDQVVESWVESYIADKIIEATEEDANG